MDNVTFCELCKQIYLQQFGNRADVQHVDFTNETTGDKFRFRLTNKTLQLFTIEKM